MNMHVPGEACATKSELLGVAKQNLHVIQTELLHHGFILLESYYDLPQALSCWDATKGRWKPVKLNTSPLRFVAQLDGVSYVFILNNIATNDILINVWTLTEINTSDGTSRMIQEFGRHLGTYVAFLTTNWEKHFFHWFHVFHDQIKAAPHPEEMAMCSLCRKITSIKEVGAIVGVHSLICKDCVDKYHSPLSF